VFPNNCVKSWLICCRILFFTDNLASRPPALFPGRSDLSATSSLRLFHSLWWSVPEKSSTSPYYYVRYAISFAYGYTYITLSNYARYYIFIEKQNCTCQSGSSGITMYSFNQWRSHHGVSDFVRVWKENIHRLLCDVAIKVQIWGIKCYRGQKYMWCCPYFTKIAN
jgi:hypothetical protein